MKLAIVGSGISAMTCAHYLKGKYDISIFEKNDYLGGHTHTHRMDGFTLDTGFIVFNLHTYPNLLKMFEELGIERRKSDMSFAVHNLRTGLQYTGYKPFAQRRNLLSPRHWKFLREIQTFFRVGQRDLQKNNPESIREYCKKNGLSDYFLENFIVPLSSAIWCPSGNPGFCQAWPLWRQDKCQIRRVSKLLSLIAPPIYPKSAA